MQKYDLFVGALKHPDTSENRLIEEPALIIQHFFWQHLIKLGFTVVDYNTQRKVEARDLRPEEIANLNRQPFYISEHYITQRHELYNTTNDLPYNIRPTVSSYRYCHKGKYAQNQWQVIGTTHSGKTCLIHELRKVIASLVPNAEIIVCENDYTDYLNIDVTSNEDTYRKYRDEVKEHPILIGTGPGGRFNVDGTNDTNVNL